MTNPDNLVGEATFDRPGGSPDTARPLQGADLTRSLKAALRQAFPGVHFAVRGSRGTGRGWYSVDWVDGPSADEVTDITVRYQSRQFNGMVDGYDQTRARAWEENGEWVHGTSCGITPHRKISDEYAMILAAHLCERYGFSPPEGPYGGGRWNNQMADETTNWGQALSRYGFRSLGDEPLPPPPPPSRKPRGR